MAIDKRGKRYRARYNGACAAFGRKTDAERWITQQKIEQETLKYLPSKIEEHTVKELFEIWMENHAQIKKASTSIVRDYQIFRDYIGPHIGNIKCHHVSNSQVEHIVTALKKEARLSDKSINNIITLIKTLFNYGLKKNYLLRSPALGISKFRIDENGYSYWDKNDALQFLRFAKNKYTKDKTFYVFYLTALHTGMRLGEIISLKWDCVDLEQKIITVSRTYDPIAKDIKDTTKGRRTRFVGIPDALIHELRELKCNKPKSEFVFSNQVGHFLDPNNLRSRNFERDVKEAGVKRIRIHDMRHTFASHYVMSNGEPYVLKSLLGHQDIKTTMKYAHLDPDHVLKTTNIVDYGMNIPEKTKDNVVAFKRVVQN
ncbi:MAG: site-specific integrase [bacterium]